MTLYIPTPTLNLPLTDTTPDSNVTAWAEAELRSQQAWEHLDRVRNANQMVADQLRIAHAAQTPEAMILAAEEIRGYLAVLTAEDVQGDWTWIEQLAESTERGSIMYGGLF